nr:hypothetical protein SHINE37_90040 [Rhizobiaceae bacterium]
MKHVIRLPHIPEYAFGCCGMSGHRLGNEHDHYRQHGGPCPLHDKCKRSHRDRRRLESPRPSGRGENYDIPKKARFKNIAPPVRNPGRLCRQENNDRDNQAQNHPALETHPLCMRLEAPAKQ